ncbi:uncharacterized protein SPSK_09837 [Sporothrix schenckii 1099-18]|uniref:Uncharacterized protein n=1 Tax=Sporothrix schenckii 1099-18 TaxID=1397361 RepID=A0A0F2M786_SPOSC|nr:uncharacterized protein SPSK_09837 [Sporothrix schenckii 1099-18]KJR84695.1 hypothetical protein SPSK_09837 [Sporothrix schenckii 1099-18]
MGERNTRRSRKRGVQTRGKKAGQIGHIWPSTPVETALDSFPYSSSSWPAPTFPGNNISTWKEATTAASQEPLRKHAVADAAVTTTHVRGPAIHRTVGDVVRQVSQCWATGAAQTQQRGRGAQDCTTGKQTESGTLADNPKQNGNRRVTFHNWTVCKLRPIQSLYRSCEPSSRKRAETAASRGQTADTNHGQSILGQKQRVLMIGGRKCN